MLRESAGGVNGASGRYPLRLAPTSVIWILQSCLSVNPLVEDMGDGHDYNGQSSYTVVPPGIRLAGRPDLAAVDARPDPGLSLPLPGDPRHRGPGCVRLRQRHRDDLPGQDPRG